MASIRTNDARRAGEALVEQSKRPLLAAMGAGDYVMAQVREQMKDLPEQTQARLRQFPDMMRTQMNTLMSQARSTYVDMAERGEQVGERMASTVRSQPVLRGALGGIADVFDSVEDAIEDVIDEDDAPASNGNRPARSGSSGRSSGSTARRRSSSSGPAKPKNTRPSSS